MDKKEVIHEFNDVNVPGVIPGQIHFAAGDIEINQGKEEITITVKNVGDRPVQLGSHTHFFEVNEALQFDRSKAWGKRLSILSGATVRFEPGQEREVTLIDYSGERRIYGFDERVEGSLDSEYIQNRSRDYKLGSLQHHPEYLPDYAAAAWTVKINRGMDFDKNHPALTRFNNKNYGTNHK